jgi:catechol 2,3-dioxygenase-like lactoylglutathione lyase family enzyme
VKIGSISGLVYPVSDLDKTAQFYEMLGFRPGKRDDHQFTCYVNWFWLTFTTDQDKANVELGSGPTLYLKVDDIDDCYGAVLARGLPRPASRARTAPDAGSSSCSTRTATSSPSSSSEHARAASGPRPYGWVVAGASAR